MIEVIDGRAQETPVHIARPQPWFHGDAFEQARRRVQEVRLSGDAALLDGRGARSLLVERKAVDQAASKAPSGLRERLEKVAARERLLWERRFSQPVELSLEDGVNLRDAFFPLRRVGILSGDDPAEVAATAVIAVAAGVEGIAVAGPFDEGESGVSLAAACSVGGVTELYRVEGAGAVAALAYGTETVRPVDRIAGGGDEIVEAAKQLVSGWVGVDPPVSPPELAVVVGSPEDAPAVAHELAAEAVARPRGSYVLITWFPRVVDAVVDGLEAAVLASPAPEATEVSLTAGGRAVLVRDLPHALVTAEAFAPQRLHLVLEDGAEVRAVRTAGSIHLGPPGQLPLEGLAAPATGAARWASAVSVENFIRRVVVTTDGGEGP